MRVLIVALALLLTALPVTAAEEPADGGLDVILDSTQHWVGTNDVLMSVFETDSGASLADAGVDLASQ